MTTPALEESEPATKKKWLQPLAYKSVLTVYRFVALIVLYAVLAGVLSYAFVMGFYALNKSWAAPLILSASDEKSLDFMQKLVTSRQTIENLKVDVTRLETSLAEMKKHRASLDALGPELQNAIALDRAHDQATGPQLQQLETQKEADNARTQALLAQLHQLESQIKSDLANGLITRGDADQQLAALNQQENQFTDSRIAGVLLTDNILDKTTLGTKSLDVLEKQTELSSEIAQLDIAINVAEKQLFEENRQVQMLRDAIATAKENPYYLNATGNTRLYFAFVPYDNRTHATPGAPIYDCYLDMIVCHQVGTVKQIFKGEETITHPIFKNQVRGFTILLDLTQRRSAKSQTVFLGRKPLFF